jgi:RNA polymerase sigma factor (sigma-70 family)
MIDPTNPSSPVTNTPQKLFEDNLGLVFSYLKKYPVYLPGYEKMDIQQEAELALWQACLKYDPKKGFAFSSFAWTCIRNHFNYLIREKSKKIDPDESIEDLIQKGLI